MKSLFEQMGGTYSEVNGYLIPNLILPAEEKIEVGIYGKRHGCYLKQCHKSTYYNLLTSGKLNRYLADVDSQAQEFFFRLVKQMAEKQGITERLKAENQMAWIGAMNNIRACAEEVVNKEIIYA